MMSFLNYFSIPIFLTILGGLVLAITPFFDKNIPIKIRRINLICGVTVIIASIFTGINQANFEIKIENLITGGGAFARLDVTILYDSTSEYLEFSIVNDGDYPIKELIMEITDHDYLTELDNEAVNKNIPLTLQYFEQAITRKSIGNIGAHKTISSVANAIMDTDSFARNFTIKFNTLYDHYYQYLNIQRDLNKKLKINSLIQKEDKILYSQGDINFFNKKNKPSLKQDSNFGWILRNQGESITVMAINGKWRAFDIKGRLVDPSV